MKNLMKGVFFFSILVFMTACSGDDDNSSTTESEVFVLKGEEYSVMNNSSSIQIITGIEEYNTAQIAITGIKENKSGTLRFLVNFTSGDEISGTYLDGDFFDEVGVFDSESSIYVIQEIVDGSQQIITSEGGEGTLKISHNGANNYTFEFNVTYDDGEVATGNLTTDFVVQSL